MKFDYIVVGAGSAGCAVASRLSENGRFTVALIEAGGRDTYPWIQIFPLAISEQWATPKPTGAIRPKLI